MTVNVCPAISTVPVRTPPVLAATANVTVPAPAPLAPAVIVIHAAEVVALQGQPLPAVTLTLTEEPDAPTLALVDPIAAVHVE